MPRTRGRSCDGKRAYATEADARNALRSLVADGAYGDNREVYGCRFCEGWHIGHRRGSGGRRR